MRFMTVLMMGMMAAACGGSDTPAPASPARPAAGPDQPAAGPDQVASGAALYAEKCAACHGDGGQGTDRAPAVVGASALPLIAAAGAKRDVEFRTAGDVFRWVRVAMPGDEPGSLSDAEYAAILAFALEANGVDMTGVQVTETWADGVVLH
jgi:cytochrome c